MTQNLILNSLSAAGVSVWLDDLSRDRLTSGNLQQLIDTRSVVGVTTNPSIFQHAISHGDAYTRQLTQLAERGADAESAIRTVITDDVRRACDVLRAQWEASRGVDGRVSIEVDPRLAHHTEATISQAAELWKIVDRPNVFIKIPATSAGMPAITATVASGISVNVTLIFSVGRHREVMDAYLAGLEAAQDAGLDLTGIHSVASLFVSRVDTEIDRRLEAIGTDAAIALRGRAAIANARLAYAAYQDVFEAGTRYAALSSVGGHVQRPLWASTGVKNPAYRDTMYITELVAPHTVSTIPERTLEALADHGVVVGDSVTGTAARAQMVLDRITAVGVDLADVFAVLENDGVAKFQTSWSQLLDAYPALARTVENAQGRGEPDPEAHHDAVAVGTTSEKRAHEGSENEPSRPT
jgi:transaldolase